MSIFYAPDHTGIAPYATQAAEHFVKEGAEVLVLGGIPHYPHWSVPPEYRRRLRVDQLQEGVRVRRLRHFVPATQSALKRTAYEATFGLHALVQRLPWKPDVVLGVVPSLLGTVAASATAARTGARLVIWMQDLMGLAARQSGIAGGGRVAAATTGVERWALRRADAVVVLNQAFRGYVESLGVAPGRVHDVPNWSHVERSRGDRTGTRRSLNWTDDLFVTLHAGNMGLKQGLENIISAARLSAVEAPHLRFVLMGDGSQRHRLESDGAGIPTLEFLPAAPNDRFMDILAAADVLLVNEAPSVMDMSLPSKLTSYFQAAVPIVAAVQEQGCTAAQVLASGAGQVVPPGDPRRLMKALAAMADEPDLSGLGASGGKFASENLSAAASLSRLADVVAGHPDGG